MTLVGAERKIRYAWITGLISGFMTLFFTLSAATHEGGSLNVEGTTLSLWNLLDVFIIFLLTFGIYIKSRVASIAMFIYFLISKLLVWTALAKLDVFVFIGLLFLYFYFEGARGTMTYHQLKTADLNRTE